MNYTYILKSECDDKHYIGSTKDIHKRLQQHNKGQVLSTRKRRPLILYAYRKSQTIEESAMWEKKYKRSRGQLERDIKNGKLVLI